MDLIWLISLRLNAFLSSACIANESLLHFCFFVILLVMSCIFFNMCYVLLFQLGFSKWDTQKVINVYPATLWLNCLFVRIIITYQGSLLLLFYCSLCLNEHTQKKIRVDLKLISESNKRKYWNLSLLYSLQKSDVNIIQCSMSCCHLDILEISGCRNPGTNAPAVITAVNECWLNEDKFSLAVF